MLRNMIVHPIQRLGNPQHCAMFFFIGTIEDLGVVGLYCMIELSQPSLVLGANGMSLGHVCKRFPAFLAYDKFRIDAQQVCRMVYVTAVWSPPLGCRRGRVIGPASHRCEFISIFRSMRRLRTLAIRHTDLQFLGLHPQHHGQDRQRWDRSI